MLLTGFSGVLSFASPASCQWRVMRWLLKNLRRTKVVVKVRRAMARGATRLAAATAERWRNMAQAIGGERRVGGRVVSFGVP